MRIKFPCLILLSIYAQTSAAQNVGIGTATPVSKLTIQTDINTTGWTHVGGNDSIIVNEAIGGVSASLGTMTNHSFRLKTNGQGLLHIYPSEQVTIGVNSTPAYGKFTVESAPGTYGITNTNGTIVLSTFLGGTQPFAYIGTQTNHALSFYTNNSQSQMILNTNGNVGIGTNTPTAKLDVEGNIYANGNIYAANDVYGSNGHFFGNIGIGTFATATTGLSIARDNEAIRLTGAQPYITFFTGVNYKGYLWKKGADDIELGTAVANNSGNLYLSIKGTPYLSLFNNGRVAVNGPAGIFIPHSGNLAFTVSNTIILKDYANNFNEWALTSTYEQLSFSFNSLGRAYIDVDGDFISTSDRSLKEDIKTYQPVLPGILKLGVSTYRYKSNDPGKKSFGLIAQDVAEYFPELVSKRIDKDGKALLGVAYNKTGVLAIKAIQEQQSIIDQQQNQIDALEKRLAELEQSLRIPKINK